MVRWFGCAVLFAVLCLAPTLAPADDLGSSNMILCTIVVATLCFDDGECESGPPWDWNIPQFIEIDLAGKEMRTTRASDQNRSTAIKNLEREDGQIFLQGVETGRALSVAITIKTGMASFAGAREGVTVAAFGACTPIEARR